MKKKDLDSKSKKIIGGLISLAIYNLVSPLDVVSYAAGVIVDEDALSKHQAIIRKTKNNIDQVDIVTPNERGLSHNKFLKFNVDENGMILNNSSQMTLTDLAGLIYGNPNIEAGKEAKTILSEVTGLTRSEIEGFIEIAGKEAEFILANPNGIYLSNGGFLNTSKVTMTTGKLVDEINENGGIVFKITDGQVELASGGSINIARVDYFNIISKASKIGGALHSGRTENRSTKEIKILTGSNTFNYETGEYTSEEGATSNYEYGIDASELGAMSAGKIT
ncbi:MAG: filamentous hemagglutinin N-terminal domain-containing protein, partial [Fusobacterium sp. JB021]|nr:filamentous hemagglutinin N-terminal domain-containing protein [Fusobacterium sp. JB021]